jgi:mRNA interferase YafQ
MRELVDTARFRRDLRRELKGQYRKVVLTELNPIIDLLRLDAPLPVRLQDHPLTGNLNDHRDLHLRPDFLLIYRKPSPQTLQLVRLGTHSELGF